MNDTLPYYHILSQIGAGGAGKVFKAIDEKSGFLVAIKTLHKKSFANDFIRSKFIEEANRYLYLSHPNIVNLRDFIIKDNCYYLVMEFVAGLPLDEYMNQVISPIPEEVSVALITEVLQSIEYAHSNNVIHMDIKPSNIMISTEGDVKVLDFGISIETGEQTDKIVGSPIYMSPEQINGDNIDFRTDIYSIGVMFYQMLSGSPPFSGIKDKEALFKLIKRGPLPGIDKLNVKNKLKDAIKKATERNRDNRFNSCSEFIERLN